MVKAHDTNDSRAGLGDRTATGELKKVLILVIKSGSGEELAMYESMTALELMREEEKIVKRFYEKNDNDIFF